MNTHAQKPGDRRQITMCGQYVAGANLAEPGEWPTCRACSDGIKATRGVQKALGLPDRNEQRYTAEEVLELARTALGLTGG